MSAAPRREAVSSHAERHGEKVRAFSHIPSRARREAHLVKPVFDHQAGWRDGRGTERDAPPVHGRPLVPPKRHDRPMQRVVLLPRPCMHRHPHKNATCSTRYYVVAARPTVFSCPENVSPLGTVHSSRTTSINSRTIPNLEASHCTRGRSLPGGAAVGDHCQTATGRKAAAATERKLLPHVLLSPCNNPRPET